MAILLHGTTRHRAELLQRNGPNLDYIEPGGQYPAEEFSALLLGSRIDVVGGAEDYALKKAGNFPNEGGAFVLEIEVPDDIVDLTFDEYLPRVQGLVQFDRGAEALRRLLKVWHGLRTEIRQVTKQ